MMYGASVPGAMYKMPNMPSDVQLEEEPMYVNAKQYHRILRRRASRAKWEAQLKANKAKVFGGFLLTF
jgi:nuclear transcription factor Y alpha